MLNGLFDIEQRLDYLTKNGDFLPQLKALIAWELFRPSLDKVHQKERKNNAGRKAFDVVLMFKIMILQSMYNLSDDDMEYQIMDRLSFMRFLDLDLGSKIPDAKTIWLFRERLKNANLVESLFYEFDQCLRSNGFTAKKGQIIDASIVKAPIQRNSKEENKAIKEGKADELSWKDNKRRQKDIDASWTQKNGKSYFGFKNHIQVDNKHKLIREYKATTASVHDSNVMIDVLDPNNSNAEVYADSAYRSEEHEKELTELGYISKIHRKGHTKKPLTTIEKNGNRTKSKTRCRVEHVFGCMQQKAGDLVIRTVGFARATTKIGLRNLAYNMGRVCTLISISIK